jgi:hypothetical protein
MESVVNSNPLGLNFPRIIYRPSILFEGALRSTQMNEIGKRPLPRLLHSTAGKKARQVKHAISLVFCSLRFI